MTWTVLPQGFRDIPHLFGQVLSWDLLDLDLGPNGEVLQYIDNLLICLQMRKMLNNMQVLAERRYKFSHAKAQIVDTKVTYLGIQITYGSRRLSSDRVQGLL